MEMKKITNEVIVQFFQYLREEEKSTATIEKYLRDVRAFMRYIGDQSVVKEIVIAYKQSLLEKYAVRSINSMLASINSLFRFLGWQDCCVKSIKQQSSIYCTEDKDTTVTVKSGSEKCYLFLHIDEKNNTLPNSTTEKVMQWEFESEGWTAMTGHDGYYYRTVDSSNTDVDFKLIKDDTLTINGNVTKSMKAQLDANKPNLSFSAAAIQFDNLPDKTNDGTVNEADAWELLPADFTSSTTNP